MTDMKTSMRMLILLRAIRAHGGRISLLDRLRATPSMLADVLAGRWHGISRFRALASILALVYVVSPVDFIPEIFLGPFGLADDFALAAFGVASLFNASEQWLDDQLGRVPPDVTEPDIVEGVVLDRR